MSKYIIIRIARVRTKTLGRIGDVYHIFETSTGRNLQVYKSTSSFGFFDERPNDDYLLINPYVIGEVKKREADTLAKFIGERIFEPGRLDVTIDEYFANLK